MSYNGLLRTDKMDTRDVGLTNAGCCIHASWSWTDGVQDREPAQSVVKQQRRPWRWLRWTPRVAPRPTTTPPGRRLTGNRPSPTKWRRPPNEPPLACCERLFDPARGLETGYLGRIMDNGDVDVSLYGDSASYLCILSQSDAHYAARRLLTCKAHTHARKLMD